MKIIMLIILFLSLSGISDSQDKVIDTAFLSLNCRYIYKNNLLTPERKEGLMTLLIGSNWSLFYNKHNDEYYFNRNDIAYSTYVIQSVDENGTLTRTRTGDYPRTIGPTEYTYLERIRREEIFIARIPFKGFYYYSQKFNFPNWSIIQQEKTILGYLCQMAVTNFLGRNWIVWFTMELPINLGPWKLVGLPGLILEAKDEEGHFEFIAISLNKPANAELLQIKMKNDLSVTKTTKDNFFKMQRSVYENDGDFGPVKFKILTPYQQSKRKLNTIER